MGKVEHQLPLAPAAWLPCALDRRLESASVSSKAIIAILSKTRPIARMILLSVRLRRSGITEPCPLYHGEFNESTQHLLIVADEEVCEWRGMHGHGSRRNRRLSCGSAGRAVNVWRTSRERLRGGTRAASIGSWLAMEGLLQRHTGGLW